MPVMQNLELGLVTQFLNQFKLVLEQREKCIAFKFLFDHGEIQVGTLWQQLRINFRATTNKNVR